MHHTSKNLSQKLSEGGFRTEPTKYVHHRTIKNKITGESFPDSQFILIQRFEVKEEDLAYVYENIPAYDLLWDICIKYPKKFFHGGKSYNDSCTESVLKLLKQNKIQEAEDYFWEHTIFNKKNK